MTGGSALSCSSLTEVLFTFRLIPSRRMLSLLPTGLPTPQHNTPNFPTLCIFVKFNYYKLTCASHREVQSCLSGNMEACVLLYELVFLLNRKEQSSSKLLLATKKRHSPNCAQYWCFFFFSLFHACLAYLCRKTSIFNLDKLSVKVL